jgi:shikimate 5-dehydrogenase
MKKSISMHKQNDVWYRKEEDNHHIIRLRKNHEEFEKEIDDKVEKYWQCDEVEITIPFKNNIKQYVEENFDTLFDIFS